MRFKLMTSLLVLSYETGLNLLMKGINGGLIYMNDLYIELRTLINER